MSDETDPNEYVSVQLLYLRKLEADAQSALPGMAALAGEIANLRTQLRADAQEVERWRNVLLDAGVIHWCLTAENKDDPYKLLMDICNVVIEWENDPAISEPAAKRKKELDDLNEEVERLRTAAAKGATVTLAMIAAEVGCAPRQLTASDVLTFMRQGFVTALDRTSQEGAGPRRRVQLGMIRNGITSQDATQGQDADETSSGVNGD